VLQRPDIRVLVVEDDPGIREVLDAILVDAGCVVKLLSKVDHDAIVAATTCFAPDCVLLDGAHPAEYGVSWRSASCLSARGIAVVMLTAHSLDAAEARANTSARSRDAGFRAVLRKPFGLEQLIGVVARAVDRPGSPDAGAVGAADSR
jgi:two-component system cell cycle sensor histidine kinase/response regulator CckA